jgi:hypothetical protein
LVFIGPFNQHWPLENVGSIVGVAVGHGVGISVIGVGIRRIVPIGVGILYRLTIRSSYFVGARVGQRVGGAVTAGIGVGTTCRNHVVTTSGSMS